ncbi:aminotransferase class V-fold PLP-dependent enzyme [Actomonas aquatica]|uniref:Aminotransferase class V-fold PLP-dependent enzyme n=1 Tax=Actomonas aquatica TaxID=2866162 RepID=A0ABZ1CDS8_9BACT|nr:aminotransferase class V-fold PLP-dependent enzyme [Opitutus sp. WL0086]WRQ89581.1 aminotransferase class V-fold PLP-dependent enzyme [Opitutus sp. WL0086]
MSLSRKSFLQRLGVGVVGLSAARLFGAGTESVLPQLPTFRDSLDPTYWGAVRDAYRFDPQLHYFNTGGLGPCVDNVRQLVDEIAASLEHHVETGHHHYEEVRKVMAGFLDCGADEVAFVRNATEGNGIIAGGLALERGDEVIFESHAHPGGSFPWLLQAQRRGIAVRLFEPDPESPQGNLERIKELITPRTRVVQVSHVTAPTGIVMPVTAIAKLCAQHGMWFHIDGAQSAGMFPFSLREIGCDSYATSGHKWLGAPRETGVLMVRREKLDAVTPSLVGAYSGEVESLPGPLEFFAGAGRYEYGTRDSAKAFGLIGAVRWQEQVGRHQIAEHGRSLTERLREALSAVPDLEILTPSHPQLRASMLTVRSPRLSYRDLFGQLWGQHQMRCRPVSEQELNAVRISCHLFNRADEIDQLATAIDQAVRSA